MSPDFKPPKADWTGHVAATSTARGRWHLAEPRRLVYFHHHPGRCRYWINQTASSPARFPTMPEPIFATNAAAAEHQSETERDLPVRGDPTSISAWIARRFTRFIARPAGPGCNTVTFGIPQPSRQPGSDLQNFMGRRLASSHRRIPGPDKTAASSPRLMVADPGCFSTADSRVQTAQYRATYKAERDSRDTQHSSKIRLPNADSKAGFSCIQDRGARPTVLRPCIQIQHLVGPTHCETQTETCWLPRL